MSWFFSRHIISNGKNGPFIFINKDTSSGYFINWKNWSIINQLKKIFFPRVKFIWMQFNMARVSLSRPIGLKRSIISIQIILNFQKLKHVLCDQQRKRAFDVRVKIHSIILWINATIRAGLFAFVNCWKLVSPPAFWCPFSAKSWWVVVNVHGDMKIEFGKSNSLTGKTVCGCVSFTTTLGMIKSMFPLTENRKSIHWLTVVAIVEMNSLSKVSFSLVYPFTPVRNICIAFSIISVVVDENSLRWLRWIS